MRWVMGLGFAVVMAGSAVAQTAPTEVKTLKGQKVTVHIQPFLNADELRMLRLVQTNKQALALFITSEGGYSAMAASPGDGLVRDGGFPASVIAIGDLPDAATAATAALDSCNAKRKSSEACVLVLEVGPK